MAGGGAGHKDQEPDEKKFDNLKPACGLDGQAKNNETKADIIGLGQGMQPGVDVGQPKQSYGPGEKKRYPEDDKKGP